MTLRTRESIATVLAAIVVACNDTATPTSPTSEPTATPSAEPTLTEEFSGSVGLGGSSFYSFIVEQNGSVRVRLTWVSGMNVPPTVWMGLGLGTPSGEGCATTTSLNTQAGDVAQISGTYVPGIYCASVWDIGNLFAPARFYVTIDHP